MNILLQYSVFIKLVLLLFALISPIYSQTSLSIVTSPPFECRKDLELRCIYSGSTSCCAISRLWTRSGNIIVNGGAETTTTGKYTEEVSVPQKTFTLTIKNLSESDFGIPFVCSYAGDASNPVNLKIEDYTCGTDPDPDCKICGLYCWLYNLIGVVLSTVVAGLIIHFCIDSLKECRTMVIISGTVVSLIVTAIVAPLIGVYACPCDYGNEPACIPIGFISGIIFGIVIVVNVNKGKGTAKDVPAPEKPKRPDGQ